MRSRPSAARARTDFSASRDAWNAWDEDLSWVARSRREEVRFSCSRRSVDRASSVSASGGGEVGVGLWRDDPVAVAVAVVDGVAVSLRCLFRSAGSGVVVVGAELASIVLVGGGMVDDVVMVVVFAVGVPLARACLETSSSGVASSAVLVPSSGVPKRSSEESASSSSSSKLFSLSHPLTRDEERTSSSDWISSSAFCTCFRVWRLREREDWSSWRRSTGLICGRLRSRACRFARAYSMFLKLR